MDMEDPGAGSNIGQIYIYIYIYIYSNVFPNFCYEIIKGYISIHLSPGMTCTKRVFLLNHETRATFIN